MDFTGETTLDELAALLASSKCVVTNDSGPMHIAQALGMSVVSIFGPTDPGRCGPWLGKVEPFEASIDCAKCYRKTCWHLTCMKRVSAEDVLKRALKCII
jgi:ADP-heptose:LPS heptosyltransferase